MEKIEELSFSSSSGWKAEYNFLKNGQNITNVIARLNLFKDPNDWLSMQLNPQRCYFYYGDGGKIGEQKKVDTLHGRVILMHKNGSIFIGYFENGKLSTGKYIEILSNGWFRVGEIYLKEGKRWKRGKLYRKNGSE